MVDLQLTHPGLSPEEYEAMYAKRRRVRLIILSVFVVVFVLPAAGWFGWKLYQRSPSASEHYEQGVAYLEQGNLQSAVINFKNVLKVRAGDADARFQLGKAYLLLGDGAAAQEELEQVKALGNNSDELRLGLLRAKFLQGEFAEVLSALTLLGLTTPASNVLKGDALLALNYIDEAEHTFASVLVEDADNIKALHGLSRVSMVRGDLQTAEQRIASALGLSETDIASWLIKGDIAFGNRDFETARVAFERALGIRPNHVGARLALIQALLELGQTEAADTQLKRLHEANSKAPIVNYLRAIAADQRGDSEEAKTALRTVLSVAPESADSHFLLGSIYFREGDLEAAEAAIREVLTVVPAHLPSTKLLAAIQMAGRRPDQAAESLAAVRDAAPEDVQLLTMLGKAYLQAGKFDAANRTFVKAAKLAPEAADIRTQIAVSRFGMGEGEAALREAGAAVELDPEFVQADIVLTALHLDRGEFAEALEAARRMADKQPDNPLPHNLIGGAYEGLGELTSAVQAYERALSINPDFIVATLNLARLDLEASDEASAVSRYDAVLERVPHQPDVLIRLATLALDIGDIERGTRLLEEARQHNPNDIASRLMLARTILRRGRPADALAMAKEAMELAPKAPAVILIIARAELATGNRESALRRLSSLADGYLDSLEAHFYLGEVQASMQQTSDARESYERVLALDPGNLAARLALGRVALADGEPEQAIKIARDIQRSNPELTEGYALEGDVHLTRSNPAAAIKVYQPALDRGRFNGLAIQLARAYQATGDDTKASGTLRDWLEENPDDVPVRAVLAELALTAGDIDTAIEQYEQILEQSPEQIEVLNNLAYLYHQRKDGRALAMAKQAYELVPEHPGIMDTYGWLLVESGDMNRGVPILRESVRRSPENTEHQLHLGVALVKAGRKSEARDVLLALVKTSGDFPEKHEAEEWLRAIQ